MDCSLPGSSIHGIVQARALEWRAIALSEGGIRELLFHRNRGLVQEDERILELDDGDGHTAG